MLAGTLLLFVDRGIAFQVLDAGRRAVLESVGEKKGSSDLFEAWLGHEHGTALIAGVIAECDHLKRQRTVEVFCVNLTCVGAREDDLDVLLLFSTGLQNNDFLVLHECRGLGIVSHEVVGNDLARNLAGLGERGQSQRQDGDGYQQRFVVSWQMIILVQQAARNGRVTVDAAVTQKWPVAPDVFESFQVHLANKNFLAVVGAFRQDAAKGIREE